MSFLGDFEANAVFRFTFTTRDNTGAPATFAGTPVVTVYKGANTTGLDSTDPDIVLTPDFDSVTGLNHLSIDMSNAFFVTQTDYSIVVSHGTVSGVSIIGETVGTFSIENHRAHLPSPTAKQLMVTVKETDTNGDPVSGVNVSLWDSTNTTRIQVALNLTDTNGQTILYPPTDGAYKIRAYGTGYAGSVTSVTVSGDTSKEVYVASFVTTPIDPTVVRIWSVEHEADGVTPIVGQTVTAFPTSSPASQASGGIGHERWEASATTDATGYWYLDLAPGTAYTFDLSATRGYIYTSKTTPASGSSQLESL